MKGVERSSRCTHRVCRAVCFRMAPALAWPHMCACALCARVMRTIPACAPQGSGMSSAHSWTRRRAPSSSWRRILPARSWGRSSDRVHGVVNVVPGAGCPWSWDIFAPLHPLVARPEAPHNIRLPCTTCHRKHHMVERKSAELAPMCRFLAWQFEPHSARISAQW